MNNSFTRPPRVVGGNKQVIRATDFNLLSRGIEELQNAIFGQRKTGTPGAASAKPPFWTVISKIPDSDPPEYQVTVTLGYLAYQSNTPAAQGSALGTTGWLVPQINGVSLESEEVQPLVLPAVESWVYLRVKTDSDGFPKDSEVTVEAFDEQQESVHHVRLSPTSGETEGDYFFLILKTKADESTPPKPIPERRITGNREMPNQLVEILNLGEDGEPGRQEIYKGYDIAIDKHDFRAVLQQQTPGEEIIEPLDPGSPEEPPVTAPDGTVISEGKPAVPPEEPGDYIRWRTIDGRSSTSETETGSTRQIQIRTRSENDENNPGRKKKVVEVVGNDFTETYTDPFGAIIDFNDGLATSITPSTLDGWWGTIEWVFYDGGPYAKFITLTFERGILKQVQQNNSVGDPEIKPGTEDAPGSIAHVTTT